MNALAKWLTCSLAAAASACVHPVDTPRTPDPADETYTARGNEPGWHLAISEGRISYTGDYGETRIEVPRPDPRPTFNGRRYETAPLTVDITYSRCNDDMSGHGYQHQVMVITPEATLRGCGGERVPEWDV